MNTFNKNIIIPMVLLLTTLSSVNAAYVYIDSPRGASSNREPLSLSILLNSESDVISGLSGDFSFPTELFDVKNITTQNGVVSLWISQPHVSDEKTFDQRTHIKFEGIIPGGFNGVRSAYSVGVSPGIVFTVTLIPKGSGGGNFKLEDVELHAYDNNGTMLASKGDSRPIFVPVLTGKEIKQSDGLSFIDNRSVSITVNKSELINSGAPYVYIHEEDPARAIDHIEIAETSEYNPSYVSSSEWHTVKNPYTLTYTSRTKYIHAKIIYTNNTYTMKSIPPVENSQALLQSSRILVYIIVAISLLLYFYGKNFLHIFFKTRTKIN